METLSQPPDVHQHRIESRHLSDSRPATALTNDDRQLLVESALNLYLGRLQRGISVRAADLVRLARYCDPPDREVAA
jgi:hypothetical protein